MPQKCMLFVLPRHLDGFLLVSCLWLHEYKICWLWQVWTNMGSLFWTYSTFHRLPVQNSSTYGRRLRRGDRAISIRKCFVIGVVFLVFYNIVYVKYSWYILCVISLRHGHDHE